MYNRLLANYFVKGLFTILVTLLSCSFLIFLTTGVGHASCHPRQVNCCGTTSEAPAESTLSYCTRTVGACCSVCSGDNCNWDNCCLNPCSCDQCAPGCYPWLCDPDPCYKNPNDPCCTKPDGPCCGSKEKLDKCCGSTDSCCGNPNQCCTKGN